MRHACLAVIVTVLAIGCNALERKIIEPSDEAVLVLNNQNWDAVAVVGGCASGMDLVRVNGLELGQRVRKRFRVRSCTEILFAVRLRGGSVFRYRFPTPIRPNGAVCLTLQPSIRNSFATDCSSYAIDATEI